MKTLLLISTSYALMAADEVPKRDVPVLDPKLEVCETGLPGKLSLCDTNDWRLSDLELQRIGEQANKIAEPIMARRSAIKERVCAVAKIPAEKCVVNPSTRTVEAAPEPPKSKPEDKQ